MDLVRKIRTRGRKSKEGSFNVWMVNSQQTTACEFPPEKRIIALGNRILGDSFLGIDARRKGHLLLKVRVKTSKEALDEFIARIGDEARDVARISVQTHNGLLPRAGGHRLGYMA